VAQHRAAGRRRLRGHRRGPPGPTGDSGLSATDTYDIVRDGLDLHALMAALGHERCAVVVAVTTGQLPVLVLGPTISSA